MVGSTGEAAAVDWRQQVAALRRSGEWQGLLSDLGAAAGGPSVAALLERAAAVAEQRAGGGPAAGGPVGSGLERLAEAVQQVAWEKLHSGDWHTVAVAWRDAYAAACILAAAAGLPGGGDAGGQPEEQGPGAGAAAPALTAAQRAEAAALSTALWHLDMASIMGGALLRGSVDGLIEQLQRRWQHLHGAATWRPAGAAGEQQQQQQEQGEQAEGGAERAAKRQRRAEGSGAPEAGAVAEAALLPPWSLGPRGTPVAAAELPSLEAFWRSYMSIDTPVVISGAMEDWPALRRWCDPAYLVAVAGPRTVPVEVGEHYLSEEWGQQLMTLQQFVQRHILRQPAAAALEAGGAAPEAQQQQERQQQEQPAQEEAAAGRDGEEGGQPGAPPPGAAQHPQRGYLAQHPLFDQIPALAADIREPPYCVLGEGEVQSINAWFGPPGTVTPLHTDPHPNLLCQAAGRKYVRLYSPAHTAAMYPHGEGMHTNSGRVDVEAPDLQEFPLFGSAPFQDCVLEAGQMLFIPPGWWHFVKSLSVSFSVSFWWK